MISPKPSNATDDSEDVELQWNQALSRLQAQLQEYQRAAAECKGDSMDAAARRIPECMRAAAGYAPYPDRAREMRENADEWEHADDEQRARSIELVAAIAHLTTTPSRPTTPTEEQIFSDTTAADDAERRWQLALEKYQTALRLYKHAVETKDYGVMADMGGRIPGLMRTAGDLAPDANTRRQMYDDARAWELGDYAERAKRINPLLLGLGALIATPFAAVGAVLFGAGKVLQGIGQGLSAGPESFARWFRSRR
ncbi:hypothetical protein WOLCODRAFT_136582 [Wolfiporia cocos MD-104 SS10]|uniref:Uncharacterized protein n=1 Tax=Wolfiporia cocos (strain MD-104) TaxID=742152 RepID=A0A2H3JEI4_WOLCO|nr:hypothetical protein WOLCODRAFT_136582 [Wolfiporia cocos MD-104 SS10]